MCFNIPRGRLKYRDGPHYQLNDQCSEHSTSTSSGAGQSHWGTKVSPSTESIVSRLGSLSLPCANPRKNHLCTPWILGQMLVRLSTSVKSVQFLSGFDMSGSPMLRYRVERLAWTKHSSDLG